MDFKGKLIFYQRVEPMIWKDKKIAVIQGGRGPEREISYKTAQAVENILKNESCSFVKIEADKNLSQNLINYSPDLSFLAVHGLFGEDGCVQAICEFLSLPYTGSGVMASAICMNKLFFKRLLIKHKIPTPDFREIDSKSSFLKAFLSSQKTSDAGTLKDSFRFPLVVKSSHGGSTLGTYIVQTKETLIESLKKAESFGSSVFLEQFISNGKEVAVSFLDGQILTPLEIVPKGGVYDFKRKYTKGETEYFIPARLSPIVMEKIKILSKKIIKLSGVRTYARLDFIIDEQNSPWLLEVNTLPGLTETSLLPKSANYDGIPFSHIIKIILGKAQTDYLLDSS